MMESSPRMVSRSCCSSIHNVYLDWLQLLASTCSESNLRLAQVVKDLQKRDDNIIKITFKLASGAGAA